MKITFLGTGTSQGVPVIACQCDVCQSTDYRDMRLRSSVLIEVDDVTIVIDSGPDFRQQMLRADVRRLTAILFTHEHKDHIAGLDDVRAFNWVNQAPVDVFAEQRVIGALKNEFAYAFAENPYPGVPQISLNTINEEPFYINNVKIIPIRGKHMYLPVLGFRIKDFTYLTDINFIEEKEIEKIKGSKVVVVNGLRKEEHISHYTLYEAVDLLKRINPKQGYITHISHQMGLYKDVNDEIGFENINMAYDELEIIIPE